MAAAASPPGGGAAAAAPGPEVPQRRPQRPPGALVLLDGGLGHLLKQRCPAVPGLPFDQQFLAGLLANEAAPDEVLAAHRAYVDAGCRVLTTNSFVATRHSLGKLGRARDAPALARRAGELAREAAGGGGGGVLVAGSLPPLQESYQLSGLPPHEELVEEYASLAAALASSVDVFLAETLSTAGEAAAALEATAASGKPLWLSFTLEDSAAAHLRSGEPLADALARLGAPRHLEALLVNCCAPGAATAALPVLKHHAPPGVRVGCYANGFRTTTSEWVAGGAQAGLLAADPAEYDGEGIILPEAYAAHARAWRDAGATLIGGCCGVGPAHMALVARLADSGAGG